MVAAQAGDIRQAHDIACLGLSRGGDAAALNAFLGMLKARDNDLAGAIPYLEAAHGARPADVTIACNLISAQIDCGNLEAALAVATLDRAMADPSVRIARYRGFVAQQLEQFADAVVAYKHVVALCPEDFESWNNLGNAQSATGNVQGSVDALERAFRINPDAPPTRLNLAVALRDAGRSQEAETLLLRTVEEFPEDARALHELYVQYKREGRQDEALPVLEQAVVRDGENANLQFKLGIECGLVNRMEDAEHAFRKAIEIDHAMADSYVGLAVQYEHTNREEQFAPLIQLAEQRGIDDGALNFLRALEHRREKRFDEALDCLGKVPVEIEPQRIAHLRATLLDRLGRTDEAFESFVETNALHQVSPTMPLVRAAELRDTLRGELDLMTADWAATLRPDFSDANGAPVFLVGFPRSGTTLLDTILMGHTDVVVMEEQPPLNHTDTRVGGVAGLAALDRDAIGDARRFYFDAVAKVAKVDTGKLLIDKSPLFLTKAATIHRLFPDARFILAMRHPCDALLSCFMSNFRLNTAMSNFLRLEDAAEFYDLAFQHWERSRALFSLNVHTIVYERLVEDVEGEVRPLFDWLGLDWREEALDHRRTAKARGLITTASYSQVTEPIYRRAAGRWERYRHHLEPILPIMALWAEKFGYRL